VVTFAVCGIIETENPRSITWLIVRLMPSTVMDPFTMQWRRISGGLQL